MAISERTAKAEAQLKVGVFLLVQKEHENNTN